METAAPNENDSEKFKKDLMLKVNELFDSSNIKMEREYADTSIEHVSPPGAEVSFSLDSKRSKKIFECNSNLLKYCVPMDIDGKDQVILEHIDGLEDSLENCCAERSCETKPSSSKTEVQSMDSVESIEKILHFPLLDMYKPQVRFIIKRGLSLNTMNLPMDSSKEHKKSDNLNVMMDILNTSAKHESDEFCSFCSCKECIAYREIAIHIMMEQFKASHMIVLLLDAIIKAYSPLLRNATAFNEFEKLLENNKDIYWIASGLIYNKKYEHLDLIYDETLTDPVILVLFSSILMINNPMQLLQILSFHIKCIIKAFSVGIYEVPPDQKLAYIIDGFDHLCLISEQVAPYLFVFEKYFLNKFSLTWLCLCQRLFHQHVYMKFFIAITNSVESLKNDDPLKTRYFDFVKRIICTDMRWNRAIWPKLQRYNLSDIEIKRRKCMLKVHHLFKAVVEDALRLPLEESSDENLFYDIHSLDNRRLAWHNIMAFAKMKWPDGFFNAPNTLVLDFRCEKCGAINEQHENKCKCVTCSIGGDPFLPPSKMKNICLDCLLKQRKLSEDSQQNTESAGIYETDDEELKDLLSGFVGGKRSKEKSKQLASNISKMGFLERFFEGDISELGPEDPYHISWATFKHLSQRERYIHGTIDEKYFCKNCNIPVCMLARKLLNNEISPELTSHLISHFHPLPLLQHELRALLPNIVFYNQRLFTTKTDDNFHNVVLKAYWTFIVSLYTIFFFDFGTPSPLNLSAFEIDQSDIKLIPEKLIGNPEDTQFSDFLKKIKSFAPKDSGGDPALILDYLQKKDVQQHWDDFLTSHEERRRKILSMIKDSEATKSSEMDTTQSKPFISNPTAVTIQPTACNTMQEASGLSNESLQKKSCNSKPKKCCLEHAADLSADHCKDNHSGKKRLKKDCNHARINETRDRLRKKLQNARRNQQQQQQLQKQPQPQVQSKQLSQIKHSTELLKDTTSSSSQLQNTSDQAKSGQPSIKSFVETATALMTSRLIYDAHHACNTEVEKIDSDEETLLPTTPPFVDETNSNNGTENIVKFEKTDKPEKVIGKVIEICDMIDNNKIKMKKWIDETLTYIEGYASTPSPSAGASNSSKKSQPQTKNPKKAAKKAKQKLRKEEEKRIGELYEFRAQFQDIYFKEFVEKIELKSLKNSGMGASNKRRADKKKIAEMEANIKKLQRAKAKLEGNILELIATVKQTNSEFKFPYLPTKEQQQEKLLEIENAKLPTKVHNTNSAVNSSSLPTSPKHSGSQNCNTTVNVFDCTPTPSAKFFPNISFPYEMTFPGGAKQNPVSLGFSNGTVLPQKVESAMCYAPPQQQLSANVMTATNTKDISTAMPSSDPSKRIVTIRRVHNPNLCDSQVTVTARGSSPNEDKLLYTFINGQLVPTTGTSQVQLGTLTSNYTKPLKSSSEPSTVRNLSKSQLKKERRRQARSALAQETFFDCESVETKESEQIKDIHIKQELSKSKGKKVNDCKELKRAQLQLQKCSETLASVSENRKLTKDKFSLEKSVSPAQVNVSFKKYKTNDKQAFDQSIIGSKMLQQQSKKTQSQEQKNNSPKMPVQTKKEQKPANIQQITQKTTIVPVQIFAKTNKDKAEKKEQRRHKLINHGQFDNNPYKTLHILDSESELEVTSSSCDEEICSDVVETNNTVILEEVAKTKTKLKQPNRLTKTSETQSDKNISMALKKKDIRHHKRSNLDVLTDNIRVTTKCVAEITNAKSTVKASNEKFIDNSTTKLKNMNQKPLERRSMLKDNNNRKELYKEKVELIKIHSNGETQLNGTSLSQRKTTSKIYKNSMARTNKLSVTQSTAPELQERNTSLNSNLSKSLTLNDGDSKPTSKRSQKSKRKQDQKQQKQNAQIQTPDISSGIPARMEHFNPKEVNIMPQSSYAAKLPHLDGLTRQFQGLQIGRDTATTNLMPSYASVSANKSALNNSSMTNVSIMDQLNRGVQVENLSLPPGITLTKVDPIKSEQLRQKSESIKRLSQPLQPNSNKIPIMSGGFQQHGSTIVAPPIASYLPAQFIQSPAAISGTIPLDQGNIIMVESLSAKSSKCNTEDITKQSASNSKLSSKTKRRRNKGKRGESNTKSNHNTACANEDHSKMITLRNPMFHAGPAAAAATILQQPGILGNRHGNPGENGGVSFPTPLPLDQPAAIIKNENGMFTIRNPALHQAVTNGLALSGYRQFGGNVSYYTPKEAMAEAARTAQQHQISLQKARMQATTGPTESFSYFSNNITSNVPKNVAGPTTVSAATSPTKPSNKYSISCTGVNDNTNSINNIGLSGRSDKSNINIDDKTEPAAVRPSAVQRCISAIGSEIKNNRNTTNPEQMWSEYGHQENLSCSHENLLSSSTTLVDGRVFDENIKAAKTTAMLQENFQHSSYYNGFEVFSPQNNNSHHISTSHSTPAPTPVLRGSSQAHGTATLLTHSSNSLFDVTVNDAHIHNHAHHSCGDDSPPPTSLLGYSSSYLDDIPNTGVIRYDDASFLKNLIPGQRLNKEVSIHNINESTHGRTTSPMSHLVEITPVYGSKVCQLQDHELKLQQRFSPTAGIYNTTGYEKNFKEFDSNVFPNTGSSYLNFNKSDINEISTPASNAECEPYKIFNYDFETPTSSSSHVARPKSISDLDNMFGDNFPDPTQSTSPFLDDTSMEGFVQNLNALQINNSSSRTGEQCSQTQLNGDSGRDSAVLGNTSNTNSTNSTPANSWW